MIGTRRADRKRAPWTARAPGPRMPRMPQRQREDAEGQLAQLAALVARARRGGWRGFADEELESFPRLYRRASTLVAESETDGQDPAELRRRRALLLEAHALYRARPSSAREFLRRLRRLYLVEVPRSVRGEWKLVASAGALVYGLALLSGWLVTRDLELAFSLSSPQLIGPEIAQLAQGGGEPFRGNFTFGLGAAPGTAGWIMAHNMYVGVIFFGAGLVPPLFVLLLAVNGLMLGSYTAVAMHWGQGWQISSILWCHGMLELQALLLAGAGGLALVRAWVAPGPWTRRHALTLEAARALRLLAPVFPMLFVAGTLEAFVSPQAGPGVRVAISAISLVAMIAWFGFGGRSADE
jgi:uncharacterized membrane protein SpoIIM required for sporulation